jgi:hypothetical protein
MPVGNKASSQDKTSQRIRIYCLNTLLGWLMAGGMQLWQNLGIVIKERSSEGVYRDRVHQLETIARAGVPRQSTTQVTNIHITREKPVCGIH